jgi:hypothetical protein
LRHRSVNKTYFALVQAALTMTDNANAPSAGDSQEVDAPAKTAAVLQAIAPPILTREKMATPEGRRK